MTAAPAGGACAPNPPPLAVTLTMLCCLIAIDIGHAGEPPRPATGAEAGFVSLFDGKTLEGWMVKCLPKDKELVAKAWTVHHGTILANTIGHTEHFYIMRAGRRTAPEAQRRTPRHDRTPDSIRPRTETSLQRHPDKTALMPDAEDVCGAGFFPAKHPLGQVHDSGMLRS